MTQFRLLHITDLHFSHLERGAEVRERIRGVRAREILQFLFHLYKNKFFSSHNRNLAYRLADFAYVHRESLDAIVITGDLATTGIAEDLRVAREFLDAPAVAGAKAANGRGTLAASTLDVLVLPGNHDRYLGEWGDAGGVAFEQEFKRYWRPGSRVRRKIVQRDGVGLGVVLIDFSLRSNLDALSGENLSYLGQGKVYGEILEKAIEDTEDLRDRVSGVIWAVHFPPMVPDGKAVLQLIDGQELIAAAKECGVRHILAGHIHEDLTYEPLGQDVQILCANSPCSVTTSERYGFQILNVELDSSNLQVDEEGYVWDQSRKSFVNIP